MHPTLGALKKALAQTPDSIIELEQFRLLLQNHGVSLEVGTGTQPIPVHFSFAEHDHIEGSLTPERRLLLRDLFDLPDLGAMDDGIANGTFVARAGEAHPLALFTAPRVDYSLHRLRHYTGTAPEWFQNFVLFTNYQFYIDEFVRLGHQAKEAPSPSKLHGRPCTASQPRHSSTASPSATIRESARRQGAGSAQVRRRPSARGAEKPRASIATAIRPAWRSDCTSSPAVSAPTCRARASGDRPTSRPRTRRVRRSWCHCWPRLSNR